MNDDRFFQMELIGAGRQEEQRYPAVRLFYVVNGECSITCEEKKQVFRREDLFLVNAMKAHKLEIPAEGVVCALWIEYRTFARFAPGRGLVFFLNSREAEPPYLAELRELFRELVYLQAMGEESTRSRVYRDVYDIVDILLLHCTLSLAREGCGRTARADDERLQEIITYVNGHFQESCSLSALAKALYVSTSTLSRFFRKQTGIYFADYVAQVRLASARQELCYSSKSLTRIALDAGYADTSSFSKQFCAYCGMTPQDYRKKAVEEEKERKRREERLRLELAKRLFPREKQGERQSGERISVSALESVRCAQPFGRIATIGSMSELTRANVQFHLLYICSELHITHARIWSVFTEDLRLTDGKSLGGYNYSAIDTVLDVLTENRIRVYFDFGNRPDTAVRSGANAVYTEEKGVVFASRKVYETFFEDFIRHIVKRYGREEVQNWIFDFNEDPGYRGMSRYYEDPDYSFFHVWTFGFRTIRALVPGALVGGPVGLPNGRNNQLGRFLEAAVSSDCVPDFLSFILFPYNPAEGGDFLRNPDPHYEERQLKAVKQLTASLGLPQLPLFVPDWNVTLSTRNYLNDSCLRGAYLCSRACLMLRHVSAVGLWVVSDWVSSYYDSRSILNGGSGLLSRDSIRKPAWYALQFMNRLGSSLLYADERLVVTKRSADSFMALAVNNVPFHVGYYLRDEDRIGVRDVDAAAAEGKPQAIELVINGLLDGDEYLVKIRSVSREHGSILDEWKRFDYENALERADIKYLREICAPHMSMGRKRVSGGKLKIRLVLAEQEFQLIHIYR